jgi:hypothetical protein
MRLKRRVIIWTAIAIAMLACGSKAVLPIPVPGVVTLTAQTVPISLLVQWTYTNLPAGAPLPGTTFTVTLDGATVATASGDTERSPFSATISVPSLGPHTIAVTTSNLYGTTPATTPLAINVVLPPAAQNITVQKGS